MPAMLHCGRVQRVVRCRNRGGRAASAARTRSRAEQVMTRDSTVRGGLALFAGAAVALVWANIHAASYADLFGAARPFVNEGLMALFIFVVGMEINHELTDGALSTRARALLPAAAAAGGMLVPALIFAALNPGSPGWGIPTATDIAFAAGVLALLGGRVPRALAVFVLALAVLDDIGGIL